MCTIIWFPQAGIENIRRAASLNDSPTFIHVSTDKVVFERSYAMPFL